MQAVVAWAERYQVPLYLGAILVGAGWGLVVPGGAGILGVAITPLLALLLYATFLGVPFGRMRRALADRRFLAAVLVLNFVAVPLVVGGSVASSPGTPRSSRGCSWCCSRPAWTT